MAHSTKSETVKPPTNGHMSVAVVNIDEHLPLIDYEPNIVSNGCIPYAQQASEVVANARRIFISGKTKPVDFRKEQLKNFLRLFEENDALLEEALGRDLRKSRMESQLCEIEYLKNDIKTAIYSIDTWTKRERPPKPLANIMDGVYICKDPYGVVLVVGAWNYPLHLTLSPVVGAIAAGNCVIIKPPEIAAATTQILTTLIPKYLDTDCYQIYLGGVAETTELLKERFDYIFFTGSTAVGRMVHAAANKYLTPVTLELGGKSPVYLDSSADIEIATRRILWGKCLNVGQTCTAPDYMLCTKEVQDKFILMAKKVLSEWFGWNQKDSPDLVRIVTDRHFNRLVSFLRNRKNIALGGNIDPKQRFMEITILSDVDPDDPIMLEEIFGPILPIILVKDVNEAIEFINFREKPLALYIFSNNKEDKELFLTTTSSGGVAINDTIVHMTVETLPFGGVGHSGMGSYHGKASFDTFTHKKSVLEKNFLKICEQLTSARYPPYSEFKLNYLSLFTRKRSCCPLRLVCPLTLFLLGILVAFIIQKLYTILMQY